jgi:hypothetical protein
MTDEITGIVSLLAGFQPYIDLTFKDEDVMRVASDFSFSGFDPNVTVETLKVNFATWWLTVKGGPNYSGKDPKAMFKAMLISAVTLFCVRGSRITVILDRTEDAAKGDLQKIVGAFLIVDTDSTKKLKKTDITLARIAACFPDVAVKVNCVPGVLRFVAEDNSMAEQIKFPLAFCTTVAAAAVPVETFPAWLEWAKSYDKVVNPGKANAAKVEKFAGITRSASKLTESQKKEIFEYASSRDTQVRSFLNNLQGATQSKGIKLPTKKEVASSKTRGTM